jgi:hypothetical protein
VKLSKFKKLPCQKEGLIKVIEDIEDDVVVGGRVDVGTWKLIVNENDLLRNSQRRAGTIGDIPCEKQVGVFTLDSQHGPCREAEQHHYHNPSHFDDRVM